MTYQDSAYGVSTMHRGGQRDSANGVSTMHRDGHQDSASAPTTRHPYPPVPTGWKFGIRELVETIYL